jgi:hypothetical protein
VVTIDVTAEEAARLASSLLESFKEEERQYENSLLFFVERFIGPLSIRDTAFKRKWIDLPSVALVLNMFRDIRISSSQLLTSLDSGNCPETSVAFFECFLQLAPVLQTYAR